MQKDIGEKVKLIRKSRGLKQDELAKVLNLSKSQVSNLEKGRRNFSLKQLETMCEYFKIDMSYFIMAETTDECIELIDKAKVLFASQRLSREQKDDLFASIMRLYLDSKDKTS